METTDPNYFAKVIADSLNVETGSRLTSIHLRLPWYITPELLRHRVFSFSSRSTRAVPVNVMLEQVRNNPCIPPHFGMNKRGMQADTEIDHESTTRALMFIRRMAAFCANDVQDMSEMRLHKQVANKYLMPWLWCDILVSSVTWANFLALRLHPDAAPEMQIIARLMADALVESEPRYVESGDWHTPFVTREEHGDIYAAIGDTKSHGDVRIQKISAARIARISVTNFEDAIINYQKDIDLADRLITSKPVHASPFEHVAKAGPRGVGTGNYGKDSGWLQIRSLLSGHTATSVEWKGKLIQ